MKQWNSIVYMIYLNGLIFQQMSTDKNINNEKQDRSIKK